MSQPQPFTACLITFNEEANLEEALESVAFADEIVVVDSHSTDRTRDIATSFRGCDRRGREVRPRVIERDWPGHVEQKNFAIDQASHEWVLCLDADERVTPELRLGLEAALTDVEKNVQARIDGFSMARRTFHLGRWILRGGWYPDRKVRLFRRTRGRWGGVNPHDHVYVEGKVQRLQGDLLHYTYKNLAEHLRTINSFTDIAAREKFERGVGFPVLRMLTQPPFKFLKMFVLKQGFREGLAGFVIAVLGGYYVFLKYAKLWELRLNAWREAPVSKGAAPEGDGGGFGVHPGDSEASECASST